MKKIKEYFNLIKKLIVLIKSLSFVMILAIIFGSVGNIIASLIPVVGAIYISDISKFSYNFYKLLITLIIMAVGRSLLRYLEQLSNHYVAFRVLEIIRDKIFRKLRYSGLSRMEGRDRGKLVSIITSDIELLEVFYAHTISPVCIAIIHTSFFFVFLLRYSIYYSLLLLIFHLIMAIFIPILVSNRARNMGDKNREDISKIHSYLMDTFNGIEEVHQYFEGDKRRNEIINLTKNLNGSSKKLSKIHCENQAISNMIILLGNILILSLGGFLYLNKIVSLEGFLYLS